MPQRMAAKEEEAFWLRLDLGTGEDLELGVPLPDLWIEDMGQWLWWGPEPVLAQGGLH